MGRAMGKVQKRHFLAAIPVMYQLPRFWMWQYCVACSLHIGKRRVYTGHCITCTTGEFHLTISLVLRQLNPCRLRDISEDTASQQQPRRRSNSLPIPKIEVSIFQNDNRRQEPKDFIEVPEVKDVSPLAGRYILYEFA